MTAFGPFLTFAPILLDPDEFLTEPRRWDAIEGTLEPGSLGFTYCGVPVVYQLGTNPSWVATWGNGTETTGVSSLDRVTSAAVFSRTGQIAKITVTVTL